MTQADTAVAIDRLRAMGRGATESSVYAGPPSTRRNALQADLRSLITAYESQAERLREVEGASS